MRRAALVGLSLVAALGCAEDPVPGLETEKREILATTLPRKAFWEEVERKGGLLREARSLETEGPALAERLARHDAELASLESALAAARDGNTRAAGLVAEAEARRAELERERRRLEATLEAFAARSREAGAAPEATP